MRDEEFKNWIWGHIKAEAEAIEREVENNPELKDFKMSPEEKERIWNNIMSEIKRREADES